MNAKQKEMLAELKDLGLAEETFCLAPYITTDLDQDGSVLTCYRGKDILGNWKHQPFDNSFNGDKIKEIRRDLFLGNKHSNCRSCYMAEEKGSVSPRMNFFFDWQDTDRLGSYLPENLIDIIKQDPEQGVVDNIARSEIRPSSLCNLRCMHCSPHSSTKWIETLSNAENFDLYRENSVLLESGEGPVDSTELTSANIVTHYRGSINSDCDYKEDILDVLDASGMVTFTGGEPLLTPEHRSWLKHFVDTGSAATKSIEYSTNLNIKNLESYFDLWKHFKNVNFRVSVDASFDTYEYFRTFANKALLEENIKKLQEFKKQCKRDGLSNIKLSCSITFNMFSALRWKEILKDWSEHFLDFHASLILNQPVSVKYLPRELSTKALEDMQWCLDNVAMYYSEKHQIDKFIQHTQNCMNYIKGFDNQFTLFPDQVVRYINFCDKTSNNDYRDFFPELEKYMVCADFSNKTKIDIGWDLFYFENVLEQYALKVIQEEFNNVDWTRRPNFGKAGKESSWAPVGIRTSKYFKNQELTKLIGNILNINLTNCDIDISYKLDQSHNELQDVHTDSMDNIATFQVFIQDDSYSDGGTIAHGGDHTVELPLTNNSATLFLNTPQSFHSVKQRGYTRKSVLIRYKNK